MGASVTPICGKVMHVEYDMRWVCNLPKGHSGPHNSSKIERRSG